MKEIILTNGITIFIALIAAFIALYQVKANIISSARINWIEKLRTNLGAFCLESGKCGLLINNIADYAQEHTLGIDESDLAAKVSEIVIEHYPEYIESCRRVDILGYEIFLFLNSNNKDQKELEYLVNLVCTKLRNPNFFELDQKELNKLINKIVAISKIVIKNEWKKSKRLFKL